jgi:PAS domain S-box-containing protein
MLPQPPADAGHIGTVMLLGPVFQWGSAALLLLIFVLFLPLSSQRRLIVIWCIAWTAELVAVAGPAGESFLRGIGRPIETWTAFLDPFHWPAEFLFLAAIATGAFGASGRFMRLRTERWGFVGAVVAGFVLSLTQFQTAATWIQFVATPIVFFACAQALLTRAQGVRARGLMFLGAAMTIAGTLTSLHLFRQFEFTHAGALATLVRVASNWSGYGDAIVLALVGAAAIVVIVQEAMLDAAQAHETRIRAAAASESRLTGIIHAAQEAIVTADPDGRIELLNSAAATLLGMTQADAIGRRIDAFVPEIAVSLDQLDPGLPPTPAGGNRGMLATQLGHGVRSDSSTFPVEFTIGRLQDGGRWGSVIVLRDLTERHAVQAQRELFERRMAESEKMLAIGRIVSGVAHELNNPLAVVLGQSEQLVESAPPGEVRSGLKMIHQQAHRARHIVKDLLAFVRHNEEHREPVNLVRLAERTIAAQLDTAMTHGVTLLTDLPRVMPSALVDPAAVEQILVNLIDNAVDAAGADGTARISAAARDGYVELVVEDSGRGVPEELVGRIFEPFFSTKGPGHGTGLGLSVSSGLAQQQGGTLRIENRPCPGVGARFVLSVPIAPITAADSSIGTETVTFPRARTRPDGNPAEVMLIDDEHSVRATLAKMFKRAGWQVRHAESGNDAVAWLDSMPADAAPDLILCDLKMPGMSGRDVFEHIRTTHPCLVERLIFVTGDVVESVSNGFIAASGREVVEKPFTVAEISRAVDRVIHAPS